MPIEFQCLSCGKAFKVGDDKAGRKFKCPVCQTAVTVPSGSADAEFDEFGELGGGDFGGFDFGGGSAPVAAPSPAKKKKGKGKGKKSSKSEKSNTPLILGIAGGIVALVGIVIGIWILMSGNGNDADGGNAGVASGGNSATGGGTNAAPQPRTPADLRHLQEQYKLISVGALNYHDAIHAFPVGSRSGRIVGSSEWFDENGRPYLSWRVHILPFINQKALFDQFHLNESWDSPHNSALLSQMPDVYRSTASRDASTSTRMVMAYGPEAAFSLTGPDTVLFDVRDGLSSTLFVFETSSELAVPWTKPDDLTFDPDNPLGVLGAIDPGGVPCALLDGSPRLIRPDISSAEFKALVTANGGEVVEEAKCFVSDGFAQ